MIPQPLRSIFRRDAYSEKPGKGCHIWEDKLGVSFIDLSLLPVQLYIVPSTLHPEVSVRVPISVCVNTRLRDLVGSPAVGRVDRIFEPGFPGGILAAASGFLLHDRHAHHNRFWTPCSECWLKTLPSFTRSAGDFPVTLFYQWLSKACRFSPPVSLWLLLWRVYVETSLWLCSRELKQPNLM